MTVQIARAIDEQSNVLVDVSRKIDQLAEIARGNADLADESSDLCTQVAEQLAQLLQLIEQFQRRVS